MLELIKKLTEAWGPSGYEYQVRKLIEAEVADLCDEMHVDPLGNLICKVGSGGKRVMVAAHMDEIGVMTNYLEPQSNYLRFTNMGGLLWTTLAGNRVKFEDGTIGVIGVHDSFGSGRTSIKSIDHFYIDAQDETGTCLIEPGSPGTLWREIQSRGKRVIAKSLDDRIGCVVAIETMKRLKESGSPNEVVFAFTVQEEVGLRGAGSAAYHIEPEIGISLDVTSCGDEIQNRKMQVKLGGGATIKLQDSKHIVPKAIIDWMIEGAESAGIPYQREILVGGSTDAAAIQLARAGVPSGCISIPCRFIHTTSETVDLGDVQACIDLLSQLLSHEIKVTI